MTRRDFAIVFWAYVGIELLVGGLSRLLLLIPWGGGGPAGAAPSGLLNGPNVALAILFLAGGTLAILSRGRLARWVFGEPRQPEAGADPRAASPTLAWDLGALGVAAVGVSRLTEGLALLPWAVASAQTPGNAGFTSAREMGFFASGLTGLALGVLLIANRRQIAARMLRVAGGRSLAGSGAEIPALGFALLGLAWAMGQLPQLIVYMISGSAGGAFSGPWWSNGRTLDLVTRIVYLVVGLALFFTAGSLAEGWQRRSGRPLPPAAELLGEKRKP